MMALSLLVSGVCLNRQRFILFSPVCCNWGEGVRLQNAHNKCIRRGIMLAPKDLTKSQSSNTVPKNWKPQRRLFLLSRVCSISRNLVAGSFRPSLKEATVFFSNEVPGTLASVTGTVSWQYLLLNRTEMPSDSPWMLSRSSGRSDGAI